jgi:tetratricopeptide (TPR) repeat protein
MGVSAAAFFFLVSCYGYRAVSIERKLTPVNPVLAYERALVADGQGEGASGKRPALRFTVVRYFALMRSSSPVAVINNRAAEYAGLARYGEAEILLREALAEDKAAAAVCNNLGIICELAGRRNEAFSLYSTACLREPDNTVFRNNFLGFTDSGTGRK